MPAKNICYPFNSTQSFIINLIFHIAILFLILGVIFITYISYVIRSTIISNIKNIVNDGIMTYINSLSVQELALFNNILIQNKQTIDNMVIQYSQPAEATIVNNEWVRNLIIYTIVVLFILLITIVLIIKYRCGYDIHLVRIIIINFIIFTFVGIVEYLFFTNIIVKYVPVKPSYFMQKIFGELQILFQ